MTESRSVISWRLRKGLLWGEIILKHEDNFWGVVSVGYLDYDDISQVYVKIYQITYFKYV